MFLKRVVFAISAMSVSLFSVSSMATIVKTENILKNDSEEKVISKCINNMGLFGYSAFEKGEEVTVNFFSYNVDGRVFHDGPITLNDLKEGSHFMKKKELLAKLPSRFSMKFPKKNCEIKNGALKCRAGKLDPNPINATTTHFWVSNITTSLDDLGQVFPEKNQDISFRGDGFSASFQLSYYPDYGDHCQ